MNRIIKKVKFKLIKLKIKINDLLNKNKYKISIAIVSCDKWKNKVLEDLMLKYYFNKKGIKAEIISYEKCNNLKKYNAIIIRSIWGFDKNKFNEFLRQVKNENVLIFNNIETIKANYDKYDQYKLLDKYEIKHIPTHFLEFDKDFKESVKKIWEEKFSEYTNLVIKPSISESGNNTFCISDINDLDKCNFNTLNKSKLMIQPFIKEIKNGEISTILINHEYSHSVIRHPGVFDNNHNITYIENVDKKLLDIVKKIDSLDEFKDYLYLRIDFIKVKDEYLVLEIEMIDPMLFINFIDKKDRKKYYDLIVDEFMKKVH